jgi:hypothetical protein
MGKLDFEAKCVDDRGIKSAYAKFRFERVETEVIK